MIDPPDNLSGRAGSPITVRALNDGKVTINGQGRSRPVLLILNDYFVLEGFNAHSSSEAVVTIYKSEHNVVRRVAAWDAYDGNNAIVSTGGSEYTLFEDVAAWGIGRKVFNASQGGNYVTCRRCWGRWEGSHFIGPKLTYTLAYNNYDMIIENSIGTWSGEKMKETYVLQCPPGSTNSRCGTTKTNYTVDQPEAIFGVDTNNGNPARSKILGSIAYIKKMDRFHPNRLYWVVNVDAVEYHNNVAYVEPGSHTNKQAFGLYGLKSGSAEDLVAKNLTGIASTQSYYSNQWKTSNISEGSNVSSVPNVFLGSAAQICRRYEDGILTSEPLWPWPMNQRIIDAMKASGRAVVDVTKTIEELFGPIPSQCRG
jgi:hypothetical protein